MATDTSKRSGTRQNGNGASAKPGETIYDRAVLGFKNYWYPVLSSKSVRRKPVSLTIMNEPIVLMRTVDGTIRALTDECAHRGTLLSVGEGCMLKGTDTITCPYHGWTYDINNGMCVAVLPEGPDSEVPGKIKLRTYPAEDRKGIIWLWMGKGAPVPVEEDIPNLILREDTIVKFNPKVRYGNWRWHAENVNGGHAQMVHKDSFRQWFVRARPMRMPGTPEIAQDLDGMGVDNGGVAFRARNQGASLDQRPQKLPPNYTEYPGLGRWYIHPKWRRTLFWPWLRSFRGSFGQKVQGVGTFMMMMPGVFRVPNFPSAGNVYYEWYTPVDEEHYIYAQVCTIWGGNPITRAWRQLWYYAWGKPMGLGQFNNQDLKFTRQTTLFTKRHGTTSYPMVKLSRNDDFQTAWRHYASDFARGEGAAFQEGYKPEESTLDSVVGGAPWRKKEEPEAQAPSAPRPEGAVIAGGSE